MRIENIELAPNPVMMFRFCTVNFNIFGPTRLCGYTFLLSLRRNWFLKSITTRPSANFWVIAKSLTARGVGSRLNMNRNMLRPLRTCTSVIHGLNRRLTTWNTEGITVCVSSSDGFTRVVDLSMLSYNVHRLGFYSVVNTGNDLALRP